MAISARDPFGFLFTAAFSYAFSQGVFLVSLPFIITGLGGVENDLGNAFGLFYVVYLIACIFLSFALDRLHAKTALFVGSAGTALAFLGILTVYAVPDASPVSPIKACITWMMLMGVAQAFYWPPMMGWVSQDHEGTALSHRLNLYNLSWISAMITSPFIGGFLVEWNHGGTLLAVTVMSLFTVGIVVLVPASPRTQIVYETLPQQPLPDLPRVERLWTFLWMSRVALPVSCIVVGLMRTQLALLLRDHLHYPERYFGFASTALFLANMAVFVLATKVVSWHYRYRYVFVAQGSILLGLAILLFAPDILWVLAAVTLVGLGNGFLYSSHQYYGVSGGTRRSALMAIHEILLACGFITGPIIGGYLALADFKAPYKFGVLAVIVALLAQVLLCCHHHYASSSRRMVAASAEET